MLLSRKIPIKEKIEGEKGLQTIYNDNKNKINKNGEARNITQGQRVTRSQSKRKKEGSGLDGIGGVASSSDIPNNSIIMSAILQQMEETGNFCGFSMSKTKGRGGKNYKIIGA